MILIKKNFRDIEFYIEIINMKNKSNFHLYLQNERSYEMKQRENKIVLLQNIIFIFQYNHR